MDNGEALTINEKGNENSLVHTSYRKENAFLSERYIKRLQKFTHVYKTSAEFALGKTRDYLVFSLGFSDELISELSDIKTELHLLHFATTHNLMCLPKALYEIHKELFSALIWVN